jgi:hypothetical protein
MSAPTPTRTSTTISSAAWSGRPRVRIWRRRISMACCSTTARIPGRLVAEDEGVGPAAEPDLVARDTGIDGGAATAEEAAMHVVDGEDTDIRSE